jgi:hypothetical protein
MSHGSINTIVQTQRGQNAEIRFQNGSDEKLTQKSV